MEGQVDWLLYGRGSKYNWASFWSCDTDPKRCEAKLHASVVSVASNGHHYAEGLQASKL
jgi:hypothetical protein